MVLTERVTYTATKAQYSLNPAKLFEVVADLHSYIAFAKHEAERDNPERLTSAVDLRGNKKELVISSEAVNEPGALCSFDLAKLVLTSDAKTLTLTVNPHPRSAINPRDLYSIADEYKLK